MMIVNEWVKTLWTVLNVRPKTLSNYKHMYKLHVEPFLLISQPLGRTIHQAILLYNLPI